MNFCTIIAKNYLAHARTLARSLAAHHPDSRVWTLIIDDFSGYVDPSREPFEVLTPAQIGCEPFTHMALRYSVLELSTAVKPWLLRYLLSETGGPVTYLDPDIKAYGSLAELDQLASSHGVVLIPHNTVPVPADGRRPGQVDIMIAGIYNLGYVSLAPRSEVDDLLDWWADRLLRDCRVDPVWGYFVDQRWFDLVPGFLSELAIVREPQYNVAYWNQHSRRLEGESGSYTVDGRPLAFYHFSGFDPAHPSVLSRHQDRIEVQEHPALRELLAEYAADVTAEGHPISRQWPYSYGALGDGTRMDDLLRSLYDEYLIEHDEQVRSPFTLAGAREFGEWLRTPVSTETPDINRVLARIYRDRRDLQGAFPNLAGSDRLGLLRWADDYGRREIPALDMVMSSNGAKSSTEWPTRALPHILDRGGRQPLSVEERSDPREDSLWGVNVIGSSDAEDHEREVIGALDAVAIPALPVEISSLLASESDAETIAPFSVNLFCTGARMLSELAAQLAQQLLGARYSIGLWTYELDTFPDRWRDCFSLLDELWTPSTYVAGTLDSIARVPMTVVRLPVQVAAGGSPSRAELGLSEDEFVFLVDCDYRRGVTRQNPLGAVEAFRRAFAEDERVVLLLSGHGAERDLAAHAALRDVADAGGGVRLIETDANDSGHLLAACDCFVSLHRAESFGMRLAQAMALGKPVIATGYSGNLDFMTPANSYLVGYELVHAGQDAGLYLPSARWADPDLEHAAASMRRVFDDPGAARQVGAIASADIEARYSPRASGESMHRRLESIRATGTVRRRSMLQRQRPPHLAGLSLRVRQAPRPRPGISPARLRVFKLLLRLMRPYTTYQRAVNDALVLALEECSDAMAQLRREVAAGRAGLLAELRRHRNRSPREPSGDSRD